MPGQTPQSTGSRDWGRMPNIYRHAPSFQVLRSTAMFEALPPVEQMAVAGADSHRFIRQEDPLWDRLHEGVLTTGLVRGALGLYEKSAAKKMGIPSSRAGRGQLLRAYHHLCSQPVDSSVPASVTAAASAHNAAAVAAYNANKQAAAADAAAAAAWGVSDAHSRAAASATTTAAAAAATAATAALAGLGSATRQGISKHARQRQRKQAAKAAALQGMAPATQAAIAGLGGVSEEHKQKKARALSGLGLMSICCSWGTVQEPASLFQVAGAFPSSQLVEVGLCRLSPASLPVDWGFGPGSLPPIGASPDALIRHRTPPLVAAGGLQATAGSGPPAVQQAAPAAVAPWDIDSLLARLQLVGGASTPPLAPAGNTSGSSSSATAPAASASCTSGEQLLEVVEVKNTCPFGHSRRGGRLRTSEFAVSDRGPRAAVPQEWVPQLQLHMLCAGTLSGLLVSRSATKGTRVFRMQRDDELLRLMLLVISRLWQQHVLPRRVPPEDVFASWREHHLMMQRIGQVARQATVLKDLDEQHYLPGSDSRWFLD